MNQNQIDTYTPKTPAQWTHAPKAPALKMQAPVAQDPKTPVLTQFMENPEPVLALAGYALDLLDRAMAIYLIVTKGNSDGLDGFTRLSGTKRAAARQQGAGRTPTKRH